MSTLMVHCQKCDKISKFYWNFNDDVVLFSKTCKKCSINFYLIEPRQKSENIITDADFLPYTNASYYNAFYHESDGNFYYYHLPKVEVKLPILCLNQNIRYRSKNMETFNRDEEGLVLLDNIESFVNQYEYEC